MNLRWNPSYQRWEAEFNDFANDLAAAKAAGFKTEGAPGWVWYATKAAQLTKLKANRPPQLTITPEAREQYNALAAMEEANAKIKAEAKKHETAQKKIQKEKKQDENAWVIPSKGYIDASDLPPISPSATKYTPPPPPTTLCIICGDPIYSYELQSPPTCLWCEKIVLDNSTEVC